MVILFLWVCSSTSQRQHPAEYPSRAANSSKLQTHRLPRIGNLFQWCHIGFRGSATSSAQTSASLHPPAALRLRVLPFTRDMVVHGLCGRVPDSAGSIICHPAAAPWPGRVRRSCKSPRARILVLGTSGAHWPARWPQFVLTERVDKS